MGVSEAVRAVPYPKAVERFPEVRQSLLSAFDACALESHFEMSFRRGWNEHHQGRGQIFHRVASRCLSEMMAHAENTIDVGVALAILDEVIAQDDADMECPLCGSDEIKPGLSKEMQRTCGSCGGKFQTEFVNVPRRQIADLVWVTKKWAHDSYFDVAHIVAVERRLRAPVHYSLRGLTADRILTGQLDVLMVDPEDASHGIVVDWKDAQPLDAKILTPTGWTTMGALRVGDRIIGCDGRATEVRGVHPKGERLVYEVEFSDGSKTKCCGDHWWAVRHSGGEWTMKRLREIRGDKSRWHVPAVRPVEFEGKGDRPLDAYLLGALLGDGCFPLESSVDFASADDEVIESVRAALPKGMEIKHQQRYNWRITATSRVPRNPLRRALAGLGLMGAKADEKFVPEAYLLAPASERVALLQGLMDTDGSIDADGRISFASASARLAADVLFLVRSLGGFATIKVWPREGHHNANVVYFRLPQVPFRLARKRARWHEPKHGMTRSIRSITPVGVEQVQCIEVAADDMLYVTDDFVVTHNTWKLPAKTTISDEGFFQQRFYAWLVMSVYRNIESVTLREFYVRRSEVREARLWRHDLDQLTAEFSALVRKFDKSFEDQVYPASPGAHCGWCSAPTKCPIPSHVRGAGRVTSERMAKQMAAQLIVAKRAAKVAEEALKGWVELHGPVEVKDAKGRRVYGFVASEGTDRPSQAEVEEALLRGGGTLSKQDLDALYRTAKRTRFTDHAPPPDERAEDKPMIDSLAQSLARARERRGF